jgi:beta-lactamase class A
VKFDSRLPIRLRIARRRRRKRRIRLIVFLVLVIAVSCVTTGWHRHLPFKEIIKNLAVVFSRPESNSNREEEEYTTGKAGSANTDNVKQKPEENGEQQSGGLQHGNPGNVDQTGGTGGSDEELAEAGGRPAGNESGMDTDALKQGLEGYIKQFKGQYGIYYIDLERGCEFGINDSDAYIAASTVKIPINLYLYKKIEAGEVDPELEMTYTESDYEGGTGSIQYKEVGSSFTIKELSRLSIEVSDNIATNMLLRLLGRKNLKDYMRELGGCVVDDSENISCPRDMALYMRKVYEFYRSNPVLGGELMGYLQNTVFNDRIPKLLPEGLKIAHKIGNQVDALHDVGIVFTDKPYILAVMSQNVDESEGYDVIARISKMVYDFNVK